MLSTPYGHSHSPPARVSTCIKPSCYFQTWLHFNFRGSSPFDIDKLPQQLLRQIQCVHQQHDLMFSTQHNALHVAHPLNPSEHVTTTLSIWKKWPHTYPAHTGLIVIIMISSSGSLLDIKLDPDLQPRFPSHDLAQIEETNCLTTGLTPHHWAI